MSVRVVARIRPLLKNELEKDTIVEAAAPSGDVSANPTLVRMPNPKNEAEAFSFQFNSVYDQQATQQQIFDDESKPRFLHTRPTRAVVLTKVQSLRQSSISSKVWTSPCSHTESQEREKHTRCEEGNQWQKEA